MDDSQKRKIDALARILAKKFRQELDFESATYNLAMREIELEEANRQIKNLLALSDRVASLASKSIDLNKRQRDRYVKEAAEKMRLETLSNAAVEYITETKTDKSDKARLAANTRHEKPGGSREKREAIRAIWASGKYKSRPICAEQECAALDMSFDTALKALRNIPKLP